MSHADGHERWPGIRGEAVAGWPRHVPPYAGPQRTAAAADLRRGRPAGGRRGARRDDRADGYCRDGQPAHCARRARDLRRQPDRHGGNVPGLDDGAAGEPDSGVRAGAGPRRPAALAPAAGPVADQPAGLPRGADHGRVRAGGPERRTARGGYAPVPLSGCPHRHDRAGPDLPGRRDLDPGRPAAGAAGGLVDRPPVPLPGAGAVLRSRRRARPVLRRSPADAARVVRGVGGDGRARPGLPHRPAGAAQRPAPAARGRGTDGRAGGGVGHLPRRAPGPAADIRRAVPVLAAS